MSLEKDYDRDYNEFRGSFDEYKRLRWRKRAIAVTILVGVVLSAVAMHQIM